MSTRYDTLNVSLNAEPNSIKKRLNKTIEVTTQKQSEDSRPQNDNQEKVNKFKELYFKNQKLRKELKLLNEKLNEKLEKLKLPSVKKKAMSVDLNHNPPSKALQRQLENAYKQVTMYKKQVQGLKGKEETPENYEKLRNTENMIGYMDMEINQVQEQLKSIKNVKKLQEKSKKIDYVVLVEDVDNVELKQRLVDYQNQIKSFKDKLKEIDKKSKKREQDFKKQQAYLVALEQKLRKSHAEERELEKPEVEKPKEASEEDFKAIKEEITWSKAINEELCKKIEQMKKTIKNTKQQKYLIDQTMKERESLHKQLLIQLQTFTRLLKDLQIKRYEQTGVKPQEMKGNSKFLKLQEIQDQVERESITSTRLKELELSKMSMPNPLIQTFSVPAATKDEREWKGKMRKLSMGYAVPTDEIFQESGKIIGLRVFFDENTFITGIIAITKNSGAARAESKVFGIASTNQQRWQCPDNEELGRITGSFSQQGYLSEIVLITKTGMGVKLGNTRTDQFHFTLQSGQSFTGIFGGLRRLGQDIRITQIGFWVSKP